MARAMNPHTNQPAMFLTSSGSDSKAHPLKINHPISKKIRLMQLKLLLHVSHNHQSFMKRGKIRYGIQSNEAKAENSSSNTNAKKIRLQQLKLLLHLRRQNGSLTNYGKIISTNKQSNEDRDEDPVIDKSFHLKGQKDKRSLLPNIELIQQDDQRDDEKEEDVTSTQPSSSESSVADQSSSSLTKQELLSQLLQALTTQRPCPCTCIKTNCLLLYCECYSLRNKQKEAYKKMKLSSGLSRNANACHSCCKCQTRVKHDRSRNLLSTLRSITSHNIPAPAPCLLEGSA